MATRGAVGHSSGNERMASALRSEAKRSSRQASGYRRCGCVFIRFSGEVQEREAEIDELDAGKGSDEAPDAVDQDVAA